MARKAPLVPVAPELEAEITAFFARHFPSVAARLRVAPGPAGTVLVMADVRGLGHGPVSADPELVAQLVPAASLWRIHPTKIKFAKVDGVVSMINTGKPAKDPTTYDNRTELPLGHVLAIAMGELGRMRSLNEHVEFNWTEVGVTGLDAFIRGLG